MSGLVIQGLRRSFGGVTAVDGVDLEAPRGSVTALIGPNGAGKTTLFQCVAGLEQADSGSVTLDGESLDRLPSHRRARAGLSWTFQRLERFAGLTVAENLRVGAENRHGRPLLRGLFGLPDPDRTESRAIVRSLLDELGLAAVSHTPADSLPTGTMRLVELGRALAAQPRALLLDEPASGLDDVQIARLGALIRRLAASGMAVVVIEHDHRFVLDISDRIYEMAAGRVTLHSDPAETSATDSNREAAP